METIYRKRIDNQLAFQNQVFKIFTDAVGGTPEEFSKALYGMYVVEDFMYADDWKYFQVLNYFKDTVIPHKIAVYQAGLELSRNEAIMSGINKAEFLDNLWIHDMSKFSANEAWGYVNMKYGDKEEFKRAWHHHKQHNPHHPEYWFTVNKDGSTQALDVPKIYLLEMIADWIGAGRTYGSLIEDWLPDNIGRFVFSRSTASTLANMLNIIGFKAEPQEQSVIISI